MTLSTRYRNNLIDICCRIVSHDTVSFDERIWMNKLCDHNLHARELAGALMCPDFIDDRIA